MTLVKIAGSLLLGLSMFSFASDKPLNIGSVKVEMSKPSKVTLKKNEQGQWRLYINGVETRTYIFSQDYFLILMKSENGYKFQFLPESHIIGIVD